MDGGEARGPERRWAEISIERRIQASVKPPRALVDSTTWADVSELSAFGDGTVRTERISLFQCPAQCFGSVWGLACGLLWWRGALVG